MEDKTKITYPDSEKVYMQGELFPYLKVGMRKVNLTPTVVVENGKKIITENAPCTSTTQVEHTVTRTRKST